MNVLWIVNVLFPEVAEQLLGNKEFRSSGGWLLSSANLLSREEGIRLSIATVSKYVDNLRVIQGELITYYVIPFGRGNRVENTEYEPYMKQISDVVAPDIVHIHGTEFSHGLSYLRACGNQNVVVSIQGLNEAIYEYYTVGLRTWDIVKNTTPFDLINKGILSQRKNYKSKTKYENALISNSKHIIGRTDWDHARIWYQNPEACYYTCNESLRKEFYGYEWKYENCVKHSIFLSQAAYPVKGLHIFIRALQKIKDNYPDVKVRIAGRNILSTATIKEKLLFQGYAKLIRSFIRKYHLEDSIVFTGPLSAEEMREEYLKANVFVSPSVIENSPNSVGEAQILGVPCISSFVGGVGTLIPDDQCGLKYRSDDFRALAFYVCQVFSQKQFSNERVMSVAKNRHDPIINTKVLLDIYYRIIKNSEND